MLIINSINKISQKSQCFDTILNHFYVLYFWVKRKSRKSVAGRDKFRAGEIQVTKSFRTIRNK